MNYVNPNKASFLFDPWCSNTPIAFNPTFFNSNLNFEILRITDFILHNNWDSQKLRDLFGDSFDCFSSRLGHIDANAPCYWIWTPKSHSNRISSMTYHFLNYNPHGIYSWDGWKNIWNLRVAPPHAQHFIWLTLNGKIATYDFLQSINLGLRNICSICGLDNESAGHLLAFCPKAQLVWHTVDSKIGFNLTFPNGFTEGSWLSGCNSNLFTKSIIAATAWFIWKNRCDVIFR